MHEANNAFECTPGAAFDAKQNNNHLAQQNDIL